MNLADRIDALLPQTQCEQCGYHGCRPYAEAIAAGDADINQCPPGGQAGIEKLAALLDRAAKPLNPENGVEKPRTLARVIEADCIGCTKCIQVCPVDAILGASKQMHTVLSDRCTGCELCVPACPVDCIALDPMPPEQLDQAHADAAREHFRQREARLARNRREREAQLAARKAAMHAPAEPATGDNGIRKTITRSAVQEAIARAKAKRKGNPS
ncbi:electron transport complex subunit RsxB [Oleiagrimonas citrea]|jgi:Na+-translocating ferredoxin:NAD+ oxidoreductase subunit B|uniref:Ion-translocating oxidoreductase complex subunit B n=1 Tax=Oleiagrimonas citrea TaxID=1665687 RepID=A0A846ZMJ9_9GAMM|nr:electron transport complex subunit RsxB [Oleiagrimonas citrea]NKZ38818.1 electron transport complex subunit RsxB [Oleiagrimonas citrea]